MCKQALAVEKLYICFSIELMVSVLCDCTIPINGGVIMKQIILALLCFYAVAVGFALVAA